MDDDVKARIRRYNRNIETSGIAVIFYSIWAVIKFVVPILLGDEALHEILGFDLETYEEVKDLLYVLIPVLFGITLIVYYYVGRSAIKFARGKKKRRFFAIVALLLLVNTVTYFPAYYEEFSDFSNYGDIDTTVASLLVDITLTFILFDMIYSTFMVSRLKKAEAVGT